MLVKDFEFSARIFYRFYFLIAAADYVQVGCFKDKSRPRALPELLVNYRGKIDWNSDLSKIVEGCAKEAKKKNYMYFR